MRQQQSAHFNLLARKPPAENVNKVKEVLVNLPELICDQIDVDYLVNDDLSIFMTNKIRQLYQLKKESVVSWDFPLEIIIDYLYDLSKDAVFNNNVHKFICELNEICDFSHVANTHVRWLIDSSINANSG